MASGTISTGGQAQAFLAANPARKGFSLQNTSSADLRIGSVPSSGMGLRVASGDYFATEPGVRPVGMLQIWGGASGQTYEFEEW